MVPLQETLRLLRQATGRSLEDIAQEVGVTKVQVGRWERGLGEPKSFVAERYAVALGITHHRLNELLSEAKAAAQAKQSAGTAATAGGAH